MIGKLMQCFLLNSQHKYNGFFSESVVLLIVNKADESYHGIRKCNEFERLVHRESEDGVNLVWELHPSFRY